MATHIKAKAYVQKQMARGNREKAGKLGQAMQLFCAFIVVEVLRLAFIKTQNCILRFLLNVRHTSIKDLKAFTDKQE